MSGEAKVAICVPVAMTLKSPSLQTHQRDSSHPFEDTPPDQLTTLLESLEKTVRQQVLEHVTPEIGVFYQDAHRHNRRAHLDTRCLESYPSLKGKPKS